MYATFVFFLQEKRKLATIIRFAIFKINSLWFSKILRLSLSLWLWNTRNRRSKISTEPSSLHVLSDVTSRNTLILTMTDEGTSDTIFMQCLCSTVVTFFTRSVEFRMYKKKNHYRQPNYSRRAGDARGMGAKSLRKWS